MKRICIVDAAEIERIGRIAKGLACYDLKLLAEVAESLDALLAEALPVPGTECKRLYSMGRYMTRNITITDGPTVIVKVHDYSEGQGKHYTPTEFRERFTVKE